MDLRKFLTDGFFFMLFAVFFYVVCLVLCVEFVAPPFRPNVKYRVGSYGHLRTRIEDIKNYQDVDILFFGSSHAYRGFDTRIFQRQGYRTFNLGSSSQTPIQTRVLLKRYLDKLNPKVVVLEVYPESFMMDGVESSLDLIANDKNDLQSVEMSLEIGSAKTYNTLLYGFAADALGRYKRYKEPLIKGADSYVAGGFVEKNVVSAFSPTPFEQKKILCNDYQMDAFAEIVATLKQRGIELVLVFAPITKSYYGSYSGVEGFDSLMSSYATYYNFNEIMCLEDTLNFYDYHHMNQSGVELFNQIFIDTVFKR